MVRKAFVMILCAMGWSTLAYSQETACVFEFDAVNVDERTALAATQIFRSELEATGKFTVTPKADVEAKLTQQGITDFSCHEVTCAASYGAAVGVGNAVIGSLTKLGEKVTAEVRLVDVAKKEVVFSDHFASTSLDDLDVTLRKLAKAVATRQPIESEVTRFAVTEQETKEAPRKKSYITSGVSFGPGFPLGKSYSDVGSLITIAWLIRYEAESFVVENSLGITWGNAKPETLYGIESPKVRVNIVPWDIGLRYVFSRESNFSPFAGGGVGLHFIASEDVGGQVAVKSGSAFALHAAGGLFLFQSYDFHLTLEGRYTVVFTDAFHDSGSASHQIGFSLSITRKLEKGEKRGCMSGGCLF
jgi:TolB-like protein